MARLSRALSLVAVLLVGAVALSSCGTGAAVADARHSCHQVKDALELLAQSRNPGLTSTRRSNLQAQALSSLLKATPQAAAATSLDGSWNPLMTTINESERVPLQDLVPALTRLCRVANSSTPYL